MSKYNLVGQGSLCPPLHVTQGSNSVIQDPIISNFIYQLSHLAGPNSIFLLHISHLRLFCFLLGECQQVLLVLFKSSNFFFLSYSCFPTLSCEPLLLWIWQQCLHFSFYFSNLSLFSFKISFISDSTDSVELLKELFFVILLSPYYLSTIPFVFIPFFIFPIFFETLSLACFSLTRELMCKVKL